MPLRTVCPNCEKSLRVKDSLLGKSVRCPACKKKFTVSSVDVSDSNASQEAMQTVDGDSSSSAVSPELRTLGRFEIQSVLGRGGFGVVYRAVDTHMKREVALKVPRFAADEERKLARFLAEAQTAAKLRHPNIVPVFESSEVDDRLYIASEFVPGETLSARLKRHRPDIRTAVKWIAELADALAYAHGEEIVHRDVKPDNVMIDSHERPQLMDFGLAKRLDEDSAMSVEGSILGTPAYMSPEQARGETADVSPHSDQYSLGVMLYELITGQKPFTGSPHAVVAKVASDELPAGPRSLDSSISQDLEAICQKAMEKDASNRYADCAALARDLHNWLNGRPTTARPITRTERLQRWCRREPVIASLSATSAVLLIGVAVASYVGYRTTRAAMIQVDDANKEVTAALRESEEGRYFTNVALADRELQDSNISRVTELLDSTSEEHRDWEWRFLRHLSHPKVVSFKTGAGEIGARGSWNLVDFSPDNKQLVTAGPEGSLTIRDAVTGAKLFDTATTGQPIYDAAFNRQGTAIAAAVGDNTVHLYDAKTGQLQKTLSGARKTILGLDFSPDGKQLVTVGGGKGWNFQRPGEFLLWDIATGEIKYRFAERTPVGTRVRWSPNGRMIAVADGEPWGVGFIYVLSAPSLKKIQGKRFNGRIQAVAFSPDSTLLAATCLDKKVRVLNTGSWQTRFTHHLGSSAEGVTFTTDNKSLIVAAEDFAVHFLDTGSGRYLRTLKGHDCALASAALTSDGRILATGDRNGTVRLWPVDKGYRTRVLLADGASAEAVTYAANGQLLAVGTANGAIQLWDSKADTLIRELSGHTKKVGSLEFSPDSSKLVSGSVDRTARIWDVHTGEPLHVLTGHSGVVEAVAFAADGKEVATAGSTKEKTIKVWSVETGTERLTLTGHTRDILDITCAGTDGNLLVSTGFDASVRIWDTSEGILRNTVDINGARGNSLGVSPDGRLVAVACGNVILDGQDNVIAVIDVESGTVLNRLEGHQSAVSRVVFSPSGSRLLSGDGRSLRIWETQKWRTILALPCDHDGPVRDISFRSDGQQIATVSKRVHLWDAPLEPKSADASE